MEGEAQSEKKYFEQLDPDGRDIVKQVCDLQKDCSAYVSVRSLEEMAQMYLEGRLFFSKNEKGEIDATAYIQPITLSNGEKIYRLGGLSVRGFSSVTEEDKKRGYKSAKIAAIKLMKSIDAFLNEHNMSSIAQSRNPIIIRHLEKMENVHRLQWNELEERYPEVFEAYKNFPGCTIMKDGGYVFLFREGKSAKGEGKMEI